MSKPKVKLTGAESVFKVRQLVSRVLKKSQHWDDVGAFNSGYDKLSGNKQAVIELAKEYVEVVS
jgi:hypothetical protein